MTAPARFHQSDLERIFKAAKKADVRIGARITPEGEIDLRMLTDSDDDAHNDNPLRKKVFGK